MRRVAIVFSGGPAPGANAVIQAAASSFKRGGWEVMGILHGYSQIEAYRRGHGGLEAGRDYRLLRDEDLRGLRNARGVLIGTSRANPGATIAGLADLDDPAKTAGLRSVIEALVDLGVEALVSIGGDDTLRTANLLHAYQARAVQDGPRVRVVHVPKTIDNDYRGIDFTFGFFTAVDVMAGALQNLRADAMATRSYFVVETMGRSAGWLAYGVAIAGEAHMVVAAEDTRDALLRDGRLDLDALADRVVDLVLTREANGKHYGTIVLAEGLTELLPHAITKEVPRDEHGHISLGRVDLARIVAASAANRFRARTGRDKKLVGVQLGYESRSSAPHAFDVMLGCQLGVGAYRALVEQDRDAVMVSVTGQLDLRYVPFHELIDAQTLRAELRRIEPGSDFHRLARELETRLPRKGTGSA
jgi:6-phosphofructokinase 1